MYYCTEHTFKLTYNVIQDWNSDFALFESGVKVNPMNVKIRNNYGMELKAVGRVEEARIQYLVSVYIIYSTATSV